MIDYYEKFNLNVDADNDMILSQLNDLKIETQSRLRANPMDENLSKRLEVIDEAIQIYSSDEKRLAYDRKIHRVEKSDEEIKFDKFKKSLNSVKKYFNEKDMDLMESAIKQTERYYNGEPIYENAIFHYYKAEHLFAIGKYKEASKEISDAIIMNSNIYNFYILRLEIFKVLHGKYNEKTNRVTQSLVGKIKSEIDANKFVKRDLWVIDFMADWLYFENDLSHNLAELKRSNYYEMENQGIEFNDYLKSRDYFLKNRIDEHIEYINRLEENKRKENERRERRIKEREIIKRDQAREKARIRKENEEKLEVIEKEYKKELNVLSGREQRIKILFIILLIIPFLLVDPNYWNFSMFFRAPIFIHLNGIVALVILGIVVYGVKYLFTIQDGIFLRIVIGYIGYSLLSSFLGYGLQELIMFYIFSVPFFLILYIYRRHQIKNKNELIKEFNKNRAEILSN